MQKRKYVKHFVGITVSRQVAKWMLYGVGCYLGRNLGGFEGPRELEKIILSTQDIDLTGGLF